MSDELHYRFSLLGARIDILSLGLRQSIFELNDNPLRHLKTCPCGRALTRNGCCAICTTEELRRQQLK